MGDLQRTPSLPKSLNEAHFFANEGCKNLEEWDISDQKVKISHENAQIFQFDPKTGSTH